MCEKKMARSFRVFLVVFSITQTPSYANDFCFSPPPSRHLLEDAECNALVKALLAGFEHSQTTIVKVPKKTRPHICTICNVGFTRAEHLKRHQASGIHTNQRPYICTICQRSFHRLDNARQHRKVHQKPLDNNKDHAS